MSVSTPDLCDEYGDKVRVIEGPFRHYGGNQNFSGQIATIKCFEDNSKVAERVKEAGKGRVLVVDGGASPRRSLLGDNLAKAAVDNGWAGIVIYGYLRDVEEIAIMPLGIMALGSVPRKTEKLGDGRCDIQLEFGGTTLAAGDYLYADLTGIIVSSEPLETP
ncbi:Putative 4-hydroxy-4-methyl-2-oxoglutarate aldolase [Zhongshania aliphaticivorans]|uniref:4-hydroxy-4-methyl-2-oxoglutarate aldolase n=1 Tax=Zhongshania aliphaticivorans TaxID=1470434 RepID=A0A5S9MP54_9GAMM|nr:ribonuclease E activity regulator RraA [Zhongshania aliphaticivorans]CAA0078790.1 Putative 4-hydroxy-4-methyl-2-oxoglutarate aldolase [Zhongshania aliphaticivorans]CAA0086521.1 Putative 4-hydroxy-4-methyl-2-oxoglutarate aldolase [Zhongshania aliphaticivorans]